MTGDKLDDGNEAVDAIRAQSVAAVKMRVHAAVWASIAGLLVTAVAEARPDTRSMTCKQLQALIEDQSVVVMDTGPRTFKRFVYHQGFCSVAEVVTKTWVDASDGQCQLRECRIRRSGNND